MLASLGSQGQESQVWTWGSHVQLQPQEVSRWGERTKVGAGGSSARQFLCVWFCFTRPFQGVFHAFHFCANAKVLDEFCKSNHKPSNNSCGSCEPPAQSGSCTEAKPRPQTSPHLPQITVAVGPQSQHLIPWSIFLPYISHCPYSFAFCDQTIERF